MIDIGYVIELQDKLYKDIKDGCESVSKSAMSIVINVIRGVRETLLFDYILRNKKLPEYNSIAELLEYGREVGFLTNQAVLDELIQCSKIYDKYQEGCTVELQVKRMLEIADMSNHVATCFSIGENKLLYNSADDYIRNGTGTILGVVEGGIDNTIQCLKDKNASFVDVLLLDLIEDMAKFAVCILYERDVAGFDEEVVVEYFSDLNILRNDVEMLNKKLYEDLKYFSGYFSS